ncbi:MAG: peptidoglycan-binding protein [Chloroflexi bacterium]|nr:peptidoglycan-binding protein [Chloroflexota bacterium]
MRVRVRGSAPGWSRFVPSQRAALAALLTAAVLLTGMGDAPLASAHPRAEFPYQDLGSRGSDVLGIQHLLRDHGYATVISGVFDTDTRAHVQAFQRATGLADDGVVGPETWRGLVRVLESGDRGRAVRAAQRLLRDKLKPALAVTGRFDSTTRQAVRSFQKQLALRVTGRIDRATWRNLVWHFESPDFAPASLCDYSPGYGTEANWGTAAAVAQTEEAARQFFGAAGSGVAVGNIGLRFGGDIEGHITHEWGLDVDLRPIREDQAQCSVGTDWRLTSYDQAATRELVEAIRAAAPGHVKLIWFNDPVLLEVGLTEYREGHDNHLHVRYSEAWHPHSEYRC